MGRYRETWGDVGRCGEVQMGRCEGGVRWPQHACVLTWSTSPLRLWQLSRLRTIRPHTSLCGTGLASSADQATP